MKKKKYITEDRIKKDFIRDGLVDDKNVNFKYYKSIKVDNIIYPIYEYNGNEEEAISVTCDLKIQNVKTNKCILISSILKKSKYINEILYHEIGHHIFTDYINMNYRFPTFEEELFADYFSYLHCGKSYLDLTELIGITRMRNLKRIIKRNIDINGLLKTTVNRYNRLKEINENNEEKNIIFYNKYGFNRNNLHFLIELRKSSSKVIDGLPLIFNYEVI